MLADVGSISTPVTRTPAGAVCMNTPVAQLGSSTVPLSTPSLASTVHMAAATSGSV